MTRKTCSFCSASADGSADKLLDDGWVWVVLSAPVQKTITACPHHQKELGDVVIKTIKKRGR